MKRIVLLLGLFVLFLHSCARVGSPLGGTKDTLPPVFTGSNLDSTRVNVPTDLKTLRLDFDEYITLKNVQRDLTISPPIAVKKILPSMLGNRYILIEWEEPLQDNTTYSFNFGNAIQDLNEGNVLSYFNYAFSTGEKLEETYISGEIFNAMQRRLDPDEITTNDNKNYVVGLYQEKDTVNYKTKPYYMTKADPDGYFELNYVTPGKYRILAFEDENQNSVYDEGKEKVGFLEEVIDLQESISGMPLGLYPSEKSFRYVEAKESVGGFQVLFEGNPENVSIEVLENKIKEYKVTHRAYSDTATVWFNAASENIGIDKSENVKFRYTTNEKTDEASLFYRLSSPNELTLSNAVGNLIKPNRKFEVISNYELQNLETARWKLSLDSLTTVPFTAKIADDNARRIVIEADFQSGKKYSLDMGASSVQSFYATNEKAYQFNFEVDREENYGTFVLELNQAPEGKYWLQFLRNNGELEFQVESNEKVNRLEFVKPGTYQLRMLVDKDGNGRWEAASLSELKLSEPVYLFPKVIEIRPLWENREYWNWSNGTTELPKQVVEVQEDPLNGETQSDTSSEKPESIIENNAEEE